MYGVAMAHNPKVLLVQALHKHKPGYPMTTNIRFLPWFACHERHPTHIRFCCLVHNSIRDLDLHTSPCNFLQRLTPKQYKDQDVSRNRYQQRNAIRINLGTVCHNRTGNRMDYQHRVLLCSG